MIRIFSPSRDLPFERYFPKLVGVPYILPSEKEKKDFEYKLVKETEKAEQRTDDDERFRELRPLSNRK